MWILTPEWSFQNAISEDIIRFFEALVSEFLDFEFLVGFERD